MHGSLNHLMNFGFVLIYRYNYRTKDEQNIVSLNTNWRSLHKNKIDLKLYLSLIEVLIVKLHLVERKSQFIRRKFAKAQQKGF